jgi:hypothetical protein
VDTELWRECEFVKVHELSEVLEGSHEERGLRVQKATRTKFLRDAAQDPSRQLTLYFFLHA